MKCKVSDFSARPFLRLGFQNKSADKHGMKSYSANTRIELTAKGWLYSAESALNRSEQCPKLRHSAELRRTAKKRISMALAAVDSRNSRHKPRRDDRARS
jgi:hypothetical protein